MIRLLSTAFLLCLMMTQAMSQEKGVIGSDERYRVGEHNKTLTHDSIGLLQIKYGNSLSQSLCTGTVIGPRHVVTAAHCIFNKERRTATSVTFIPAHNRPLSQYGRDPYGRFVSTKIKMLEAYFYEANFANDLAMVIFEENLPVQALPIAVGPGRVGLLAQELYITGYPSDKDMGELWEGFGKGNEEVAGGMQHYIDTMSGQSGSAVRLKTSLLDEMVVGIHSSGARYEEGGPYVFNYALIFTREHIDQLNAWMAE